MESTNIWQILIGLGILGVQTWTFVVMAQMCKSLIAFNNLSTSITSATTPATTQRPAVTAATIIAAQK
jgi:hypothetical protein